MQTDSQSSGQIYWIWPLRFSGRVRRRVDASVCWLDHLIATPVRLLACAILLGSLPALVSVMSGHSLDRPLTTLAMTPLLLAAARRDCMPCGLALLGLVFVAHSATMIGLTALTPDRVASVFPPGQAYWIESRDWILSGVSPEYETSYWLPAHVMQFVGGAFFTFTSLGGVLIWEGLYQVDLMNVYVGNLVLNSDNPLLALGLGWHPWSVLRGVGFLFVGFEACSYSLERFLGTPFSTRRRRLIRWGFGTGFLALDGAVKFCCLGIIRDTLHSNLLIDT